MLKVLNRVIFISAVQFLSFIQLIKVIAENMNSKQKIAILFNLVRYLIMAGLLVISIFISKEVLEQYASRATSFKQSEVDITEKESVTIVVGFWPLKKMDYPEDIPLQTYEQLELGKDFSLSFGLTHYKTFKERIWLRENDVDLEIMHSSIGKVGFDKMITKWGNYFKISADIVRVKRPLDTFIRVNFSDDIPDKDIPVTDIYLTSEENSYGISMFQWNDGKRIVFSNVKGWYLVEVQPEKINKIRKEQKCQSESFYKCISSELERTDFSQCQRKCMAISTPISNQSAVCKTVPEFKCAFDATEEIYSSTKCLHLLTSSPLVNE